MLMKITIPYTLTKARNAKSVQKQRRKSKEKPVLPAHGWPIKDCSIALLTENLIAKTGTPLSISTNMSFLRILAARPLPARRTPTKHRPSNPSQAEMKCSGMNFSKIFPL